MSAVRESSLANNQMNSYLANLMGHSKATADHYYYMKEKLQSAGKAAEQLPVVMRITTDNQKHVHCQIKRNHQKAVQIN